MIRLAILAFAIGAALLQMQAELPALAWVWVLPLALWLTFHLSGRRQRAAWLVLALVGGFFYAAWRADMRLQENLPRLWEGRDLTFSGRVLDLPETTPQGLRFHFSPDAIDRLGDAAPRHLMLHWRGRPGETPPALRGGDCLTLSARLYRPHALVNPGGFDYEAWLLERGIRAGGVVAQPPRAATGCGGTARAWLDQTREALRDQLRDNLGQRPLAGVVRALAIGEQDAISTAQWTLFRQTGVTHLMSISGLHVTLFSALVYAVVVAVWRRIPGLTLRWPAARAGMLLGLLAALIYTALAGFGIPAQRTLYMLGGAALLAWLDRSASPTRLLAAALIAVLLLDPWASFAPGFWLSFGAVAALLLAGAGRIRPLPLWRTWIHAQWTVTLALTPVLLGLFHEVSLVSPIANAFAIPMISLLAVPASLLAAILPFETVAALAHGVAALVVWGLEGLARLPQPVFHGMVSSPRVLALALLGAGLLLLPRGVAGRWLGLLLFLPLFFPRLPGPAPGGLWLDVLDVGQGEAILLRTAGHRLLFDAGPGYADGEDAGRRVVAPALWNLGVNRLDGLVVSHDDTDHSGGALSLLDSHRPVWLLTSLAGVPRRSLGETGAAILAARPDAMTCRAGQTWNWDGVRFQVLHPPAHHYANPGYPDNERSCVLRVETAHGAVLLTGDIERLSEMNLAERGQALAAQVLAAPHHGSAGSSSEAFLAAVAPRHVLIPVGHKNRFGHPHPEALARYRALGARIWRTDRQGAISLKFEPGGIQGTAARAEQPRYWRE